MIRQHCWEGLLTLPFLTPLNSLRARGWCEARQLSSPKGQLFSKDKSEWEIFITNNVHWTKCREELLNYRFWETKLIMTITNSWNRRERKILLVGKASGDGTCDWSFHFVGFVISKCEYTCTDQLPCYMNTLWKRILLMPQLSTLTLTQENYIFSTFLRKSRTHSWKSKYKHYTVH